MLLCSLGYDPCLFIGFISICQITRQEISEGKRECPLLKGPQWSVLAIAEDGAPVESLEACWELTASQKCSRAFTLLFIIFEPWWLIPLGGANLTFIRMIYYNLLPTVL